MKTFDKMGFHSEDNLYWDRLKDGAVLITKFKGDQGDEIVFQQAIPANIWASIVCTVSKAGEGSERWYRMMEFHNETMEEYESKTQKAQPGDEDIEKWAESVELQTEDELSGLDYLIIAAKAMRDGQIPAKDK